MRSMMQWILGTAAIVILLAGCGKGNPPPALPAPAPVPQTTPGGPVGGGLVAGNCAGSAGQYPLSQTPFYGNLQSGYGYSSGNSIQLTLGAQNYGVSSVINVYGSGLLNLPDLAAAFPQQPGMQQQQMPTQFCVSSQPVSGGQPFPGVYSPADRSLAITMYGVVQVPVYTYSPVGGYVPGGVQYTQQAVTVTIGSQCGAWIYDGRIYGCVLIQLGNSGHVLYYNAQ